MNISKWKIIKRNNGFWYLYKNRTDIRSLGTKDRTEAKGLMALEKEQEKAALKGQLEKHRGISLLSFTAEYMDRCDYLVSIQEMASETARHAGNALKRLHEVVGDIPLSQIDGKVEKFKKGMLAGHQDIEARKVTVNSYIGSLSAAFSWAATPDKSTGRPAYIPRNPFAETRTESIRFKGMGRLPKYLPIEELNILRRQLDREIMEFRTDSSHPGARLSGNAAKSLASRLVLRPMLEFYIYTGMRAAELTGLSWGDIRLQDGFIHLKKTKGRKERMVPIPPALMKVIEQMGPRDIGRVFSWTPGHASKMFKGLTRRAGLDESRCLKGLRHSYGTLSADQGVDLDVIQSNMGHQSIKTTQIYMDVLDSRKKDQVRGLSFGS
jgi:integrase